MRCDHEVSFQADVIGEGSSAPSNRRHWANVTATGIWRESQNGGCDGNRPAAYAGESGRETRPRRGPLLSNACDGGSPSSGSVAAQVLQHDVRPAAWQLGVNHPVDPAQGGQVRGERLRIPTPIREPPDVRSPAPPERNADTARAERASARRRERCSGRGGMLQGLTPGVQHSGHTDLGPEMARISGECPQASRPPCATGCRRSPPCCAGPDRRSASAR